MYYDSIVFRFIPGIYILINNKIKNGYIHIFQDIIEQIKNNETIVKENLKW